MKIYLISTDKYTCELHTDDFAISIEGIEKLITKIFNSYSVDAEIISEFDFQDGWKDLDKFEVSFKYQDRLNGETEIEIETYYVYSSNII